MFLSLPFFFFPYHCVRVLSFLYVHPEEFFPRLTYSQVKPGSEQAGISKTEIVEALVIQGRDFFR